MNRKKIRKFNYMLSEINEIYHDIAARMGISDSVQSILYAICENGEQCQQSDICKQTGISRQTINTSIRKLERDGLVYLEQGKGRNTIVCLTDQGKRIAEEKIRWLLEIEDEIFSGWPEEELTLYLRLTEQYRDELRTKTEKKEGNQERKEPI